MTHARVRCLVFALGLLVLAVLFVGLPTTAFAATSYTNPLPAPNSVTALKTPAVKLTVTDPQGVNTSSLIMKLDNANVRGKWSGSTVTYQPTTAISNGTHTASVSVLNYAGSRSTYTWTFTVKSVPVVGTMVPADGSTVSTTVPVISAVITPNGVALSSWSMLVDGKSVSASWSATTKTLSYAPSTPLRNDAVHSVTLNATDSAGASVGVSWSFGVQIYPDMVANTQCADCHPTYPAAHPMTNCDACHGYSGPIGGFYGPPDYHPEGEAAQFLSDCTYCHGSNIYPTVPNHTDLAVSHGSTTEMTGCACHVRSLSIEHNRWTDDAGDPLACASCHGADADQRVKDALAAGSTNCFDCHTPTDGHPYSPSMHTGTPGSAFVQMFDNHQALGPKGIVMDCTMCHSAELGPAHGNRCETCHPSPRDSFATWGQTCTQGGCHVTYHENSNAGHASLEDDCEACHDGSMQVLPTYCDGCHVFYDVNDGVAPVTTSNARTSYLGAARIDLSATDSGKIGVLNTFYRFGTGPIGTGDVAVSPAETGTYSLEFWSVDQVGNEEAHKFVSFTVSADSAPPVTTSNARAAYEGPATITLTATDNGTSGARATYYRVDGGAVMTGTKVSIDQPASGSQSHGIQFWSEDFSGNVESPKSASFTVARDVTAPVTTTDMKPYYSTLSPPYFNSVGVLTRYTVVETGSGVAGTYYSWDGAPAVMTGAGFITSPSFGQGPHRLEYWSVDKVGNAETRKIAPFVVDWTAPTATSNVAATYPASGANFTISATDLPSNGAGVGNVVYRINNGVEQTGPAVTSVSVAQSGIYTLEYWAVDKAGNSSTHTNASFTVGSVVVPTTATIRLIWTNPPPTSWANWQVLDGPGGNVIASGRGEADAGWDGIDDIVVPARPAPYYVWIEWYDPWDGGISEGAITASVPGSVVEWRY